MSSLLTAFHDDPMRSRSSSRGSRSGYSSTTAEHCASSRSQTPNLEDMKEQPEVKYQTLSDPVDVAIIGGGACGLAVAIQLLERTKQRQGKLLSSLVMYEKSPDVGTGLAYSKACSESIVNMHADTMGLCPVNPLHFTEWIQNLSPNLMRVPFPTRQQYGVYLRQLKQKLVEDCLKLGVEFRVVNGEVENIVRKHDGLEISIREEDSMIRARDVALALGNFCASSHAEFVGNENYFRCPWPAEKLRVIESNAAVLIMGSRLTAIDVANFLVENEHKGQITFVSRGGRLPKVQGHPEVFDERWRLWTLAKEVENRHTPQGAMKKVMDVMEELVRDFAGINFSDFEDNRDPLELLQTDVESAEAGAIAWQTVINSTKPLVERYWNCFTEDEQNRFLKTFNSLWVTYRHAIPLQNAKKIIAMMESGQLRVVKGTSKVTWDGEEFSVNSGDQKHRGQFLIEALGQEFDMSKVATKSPLLTNLLASDLVKAHPNGGVKVDFETLRADENVHVIGSMTRGMHFYTTAIDRNAAHASRIADSITGMPFRRPLHIAFFVGSDIFSNLMLSKLVPQLLALGHMPFIFLPSDNVNSSKKKAMPFDLQELGFFERTLLQEHVIPFLGATPQEGAPFLTVEQMKTQYGIMVEKVPNINSAAFIEKIKANYIDIGFSIRCYQRFKTKIIEYFSGPRVLLNLHPGVLPQYRGVVTAIRAMMNCDRDFGYSLHHIDENFDSGDLINVRTKEIDYQTTMLDNMNDVYGIGGDMVMDAAEKFARGGDMHAGTISQDPEKSRYYTFPTTEEMDVCKAKGIKLVRPEGMKELLVNCFAGKGKENELRCRIHQATRIWYEGMIDQSP